MAGTSQPQLPSHSDAPVPLPGTGQAGAGRPALAAWLAFAAVAAGTALLGAAAGFAWSAVAPRSLVVIVAHGSADVVHPETAAFIVADAWFAALSLIGGVISGLMGYLFAVRRHGPSAMLGVLAGALAAALIARWIGEQSGLAAFNHLLRVSRPGAFLRAPVKLGGVGGLSFWPLAAALTAGGLEAVGYVRDRRRVRDQQSEYPASPRHRPATGGVRPFGSRPAAAPYGGTGAADSAVGFPGQAAQQGPSWPADQYGQGQATDSSD